MSDSTKITISFDDIPAGTIISDQFADQGVTVTSADAKPAMIFDASQDPAGPVSGEDAGLLNASAGGILIASGAGASVDPDDKEGGATIGFDFDEKVILHGITLADVQKGADITVYDAAGRILFQQEFTSSEGEYLEIEFTVPGAIRMEITFAGSGAIDDLSFTKAIAPDGIVNGTADGDLIDAVYVDVDGDVIDGDDAIGIKGTTGDDDFVTAFDGNDTVFAGEGNDLVRGEKGDDLLYGDAGMDTLTGGLGNDTAWGGDGMDEIITFRGDDVARGEDGADWIWGGDGNDTLSGDDDDDMVNGEDGDDLLFGGEGHDTVDGGEGDDIILGDSNPEGLAGKGDPICGPRESFEWAKVPGFADRAPASDVTQNTGTVDVTFSITDSTGTDRFETREQFVDGIDSGSETVDDDASVTSIINGTESATYNFGFSSEVKNASFNVTDIDRQSEVTIKAYDAEGNAVPVTLTAGALLSVTGATAVSPGGFAPDSDPDYGLNVKIEGVASRIEIAHGLTGEDKSGVNITDLYFDPVTGYEASGGDDSLKGGEGNDLILGEGGDDTIDSGVLGSPDLGYPGLFPGDADPENDLDTVDGGDGNDLIRTGDDDDVVIGGAGNDTIDSGFDRDDVSGGDGDDLIVGGEGSDTIDGGAGGDTIYGGLDPRLPDQLNAVDVDADGNTVDLVQDNGRDLIDGGDGDDLIFGQDDDDTIFGGDGNDTLDGGIDEDVIDGGDGEDVITGGQGGDSVTGGEGADVIDTGADRDVITGATADDRIDGGEAGDDFDTLDLTGSGVVKIDYTSEDREDGIITFSDETTATFEEIENVIPCFTPGTLIATPRGEIPVEALRVGDRVITRDNGIQTIRWVGRRDMTAADLVAAEAYRPVRIRQGALGHGLPERDMIVSPQHRVLVFGDETLLYFDEREVLVAARHLVGRAGIERMAPRDVSYVHIMFDAHQVILSDGAWTESFQPGAGSLAGLEDSQREELLSLFPELREATGRDGYIAARRSLKRREAQLLNR